MSNKSFYRGRGHREPQRGKDLPVVDPTILRDPQFYRASAPLAAAVDVALTLGMPLLVTGEPGSGKSGLADSIAWELGFGAKAFRFVVKSDTESRDLFYRFDTVGRFHTAQTNSRREPPDPADFLTFEPLGRAILHAKPKRYVDNLMLPEQAVGHPGAPQRSVVLIDEIDKAPREVPNDILVEIEYMQFDIPELSGGTRGAVRIELDDSDQAFRPIVVFTSNSERALPDAFLRRCVYHHMQPPKFRDGTDEDDGTVTVDSIVEARLGSRFTGDQRKQEQVKDAISLFSFLRGEQAGLERRPSLAEMLDWLDYLMPRHLPITARKALAALGTTDIELGFLERPPSAQMSQILQGSSLA